MGRELVSILALVVTIDTLIVYIDTLKEGKSKSNIGKFVLGLFIVSIVSLVSKLISCIIKNISGICIFILFCVTYTIITEIKQYKNKKCYESIIKIDKGDIKEFEAYIKQCDRDIKEYDDNKEQYGDNVDKYKEFLDRYKDTFKNYKVVLKTCKENKKEYKELLEKYKEFLDRYKDTFKNYKVVLKACKENKKEYKELLEKYKELLEKYKELLDKIRENIKSYKESIENNIQKKRTIGIIFNKELLIIGVVVLTYKTIALISSKTNLSADLVTLITVIVALLTAVYTTMKSNKSDLSAESLWRKELMNVSSKNKICIDDLLRLRASQNYKYANKHNGDDELEKNYINAGYEVRDKIGKVTNDLYNKYIFIRSETVEISFEDQNTIRNLSIALLKYDYIKRGDNVKLTHYIIRELEEDNEYQNLLNWINKEIDVDKYNKYVL